MHSEASQRASKDLCLLRNISTLLARYPRFSHQAVHTLRLRLKSRAHRTQSWHGMPLMHPPRHTTTPRPSPNLPARAHCHRSALSRVRRTLANISTIPDTTSLVSRLSPNVRSEGYHTNTPAGPYPNTSDRCSSHSSPCSSLPLVGSSRPIRRRRPSTILFDNTRWASGQPPDKSLPCTIIATLLRIVRT